MSSRLKWKPSVPEGKDLSTDLKFILRKRYDQPISECFTEDEIFYLRGIIDATDSEEVVKETLLLISAIEAHGSIRVWEQF